MPQIQFDNKPGTSLYVPAAPGPGERMLFLQSAGSVQATISLDDIWNAVSGVGGYILFLDAMPPDADLKPAQQAIEAALPSTPPALPGFAWVAFGTNWTVAEINLLTITPDGGGGRMVAADFTAPASDPFPSVPILAETTVITATDDANFIQAALVQFPPLAAFDGQPAAAPPEGAAIALPLTGDGVGCLRFQGVMNHDGPAQGDTVTKDVFDASLDPLDLFDPQRTYLTFTGASIQLSRANAASGPFTIAEGS